jgi:hypothetical protein
MGKVVVGSRGIIAPSQAGTRTARDLSADSVHKAVHEWWLVAPRRRSFRHLRALTK